MYSAWSRAVHTIISPQKLLTKKFNRKMYNAIDAAEIDNNVRFMFGNMFLVGIPFPAERGGQRYFFCATGYVVCTVECIRLEWKFGRSERIVFVEKENVNGGKKYNFLIDRIENNFRSTLETNVQRQQADPIETHVPRHRLATQDINANINSLAACIIAERPI